MYLKIMQLCFVVFLVVGCGSLNEADTSLVAERSYVAVMLEAVRKETPWQASGSGSAVVMRPETWRKLQKKYEFRQGIDDPYSLLQQARAGDSVAMVKLESFLHTEKRWPYRFEVYRMLAFRRGVSGIAKFYVELKSANALRRERRAIERGTDLLMDEATRGSVPHAIALYQFCGSITEMGESFPLGNTKAISAKCLDIIDSRGGSRLLRNVATNEAMRLGFAQSHFLSGEYYPHTPPGWQPTKR